jgi:hypothetical protein
MAAKMNNGTKRCTHPHDFSRTALRIKFFSRFFAQLRVLVPSLNLQWNVFAFNRTLFAKNIFSLRLISIDARAISR